jgi:tRNA dimethylallyltransferase
MKNVWIVCGPTASGKTSFAIELAKVRKAEILSSDSRQIYKELVIGVARPEPEELAAVPHHFIGVVSIEEEYTVGRFAREAREWMEIYFLSHDDLVICGGTGLYIKALLEGVDRMPVPEEIRQEVQEMLDREGLYFLTQKLREADPDLFEMIELTNPRRVQRALEWVLAGKPEKKAPDWPQNWNVQKLAPDVSRDILYDRINLRVDQMMEKGLWEEAQSLYPFRDLNALKTVGYQELFEAMSGLITKGKAVELIKQHTRNYAKRQLTWFRKEEEIRWVKPENQAAILGELSFSQGS